MRIPLPIRLRMVMVPERPAAETREGSPGIWRRARTAP